MIERGYPIIDDYDSEEEYDEAVEAYERNLTNYIDYWWERDKEERHNKG